MNNTSFKIRKFRASLEYKQWRNAIKERDKKCVLCKSKDFLEVDHIKSLALYPEIALDLNNGRVLCRKCHKKTDTYGSSSKFKGEKRLHPILLGDVAHKIDLLPSSIGENWGLEIVYNPNSKKWVAGYKHLKSSGISVEECLNHLFEKLKNFSIYGFNTALNLLNNENYMQQKTTKALRDSLYLYVEKIIKRELLNEEKQDISKIFRTSVNKVVNELLEY